jgi:hypothetical protein
VQPGGCKKSKINIVAASLKRSRSAARGVGLACFTTWLF